METKNCKTCALRSTNAMAGAHVPGTHCDVPWEDPRVTGLLECPKWQDPLGTAPNQPSAEALDVSHETSGPCTTCHYRSAAKPEWPGAFCPERLSEAPPGPTCHSWKEPEATATTQGKAMEALDTAFLEADDEKRKAAARDSQILDNGMESATELLEDISGFIGRSPAHLARETLIWLASYLMWLGKGEPGTTPKDYA